MPACWSNRQRANTAVENLGYRDVRNQRHYFRQLLATFEKGMPAPADAADVPPGASP